MIRAEDCGYVKGLLEAAEQLRPKNDEWKLLLPGRTVLLPPVADEQGGLELIERALMQLREELGLPPDHITRLVLELLLIDQSHAGPQSDSEPPADRE